MEKVRKLVATLLVSCFLLLSINPCKAEAAIPSGAASTLYLGDFYYIVSAINPNMVVDVNGGRNANGTNIQLYKKNGSDAQLFKFVRLSNGYYSLINRGTKKPVDINGGYSQRGTNVQLWEKNGTAAQQWKLEKKGTAFKLRARCGKYLDVNGGIARNKTNIQIWDGNNSAAQYFYFVPFIRYTTTTITLGDFSTFDGWRKNMQAAERSVTFGGRWNTNPSGNTYYNGKMIIGMSILSYKTIYAKVSINTPGYYKTIKVRLPNKIKFKLHSHNTSMGMWFDFSALNFWQTCSCGYRDEWKWDIPYFTTTVSPDGVWQNQDSILNAIQPQWRVIGTVRQ